MAISQVNDNRMMNRAVTKSAKDVGNVLREFRNYIHPHKEFADKVTIQEEDAKMFWEVTKAITRQVLASAGKSP
jgi:uridine kinase